MDLNSPGVERGPRQDYLGFRGSPNGVSRLRDVRVPRELALGAESGQWRDVPELTALMGLARMYIISALALAAMKACLNWLIQFAMTRRMDGIALHRLDQIRHLLAQSAADLHMARALVDWCLLGCERADTRLEQSAAKNITSLAAWRVAERMVSIMGGEGLETAASKQRRGAAPIPVERVLRDVRGLRVAGGVDFQVDLWTAQAGLFARHYAARVQVVQAESPPDGPPRLRGHRAVLMREAHR